MDELNDKELLAQELAKVAPEGHRQLVRSLGEESVFCPWAYGRVLIERNHRGWPICGGCLRPIDISKLEVK